MEVKVTKRRQPVYLNWFEIKDWHPSTSGPIIGKWQYIVESTKGKISIVERLDEKTLWEIYCLEGHMFEKVEKYDSYEEAEAAARTYLK